MLLMHKHAGGDLQTKWRLQALNCHVQTTKQAVVSSLALSTTMCACTPTHTHTHNTHKQLRHAWLDARWRWAKQQHLHISCDNLAWQPT